MKGKMHANVPARTRVTVARESACFANISLGSGRQRAPRAHGTKTNNAQARLIGNKLFYRVFAVSTPLHQNMATWEEK